MPVAIEAPAEKRKKNYIGDMDMSADEAATLGSPQLARIYKENDPKACWISDCHPDCGRDCDGSCTYVDSSPNPCSRCDSDCGKKDQPCDSCSDFHCGLGGR